MNILFESKLFFEVMDFSLTHKVLLLRGIEIFENEQASHKNTDILFGGVHFMSLPTTFEGGICIKKGVTEQTLDFGNVTRILKSNHYFEIINQDKTYYIESYGLEIIPNTLDTAESSVDTKKFRKPAHFVVQKIELFPYLVSGIELEIRAYIKSNPSNWLSANWDDRKEIIKAFVPNAFSIDDATLEQIIRQVS